MNSKLILITLIPLVLLGACGRSDVHTDDHDSHEHHDDETVDARTHITAEMQSALGITTSAAGPVQMQELLSVYGQLKTNTDKVTHINARFDGVIERVYVGVGQQVSAGDPLLQIESNVGLNRYTVNSPVSGLVTARDANAGEQTAGKGLLTIVDSSTVWADLMVFPADITRAHALLNPGTQVTIRTGSSDELFQGEIMMLMPEMQSNQAVTARAELDNSSGRLMAGSWITAQINTGEFEAPVAVRREAVQSVENASVVYLKDGDEFEERRVELGRQSGDWIEVTAGLTAGEIYVTGNSFVVKANIEKAGAAHDH